MDCSNFAVVARNQCRNAFKMTWKDRRREDFEPVACFGKRAKFQNAYAVKLHLAYVVDNAGVCAINCSDTSSVIGLRTITRNTCLLSDCNGRSFTAAVSRWHSRDTCSRSPTWLIAWRSSLRPVQARHRSRRCPTCPCPLQGGRRAVREF